MGVDTVVDCDNCNRDLSPEDDAVLWYRATAGVVSGGVGYQLVRGCAACFEDARSGYSAGRPFSIRAFLRHVSGDPGVHIRVSWCDHCKRGVYYMTATAYSDEEGDLYRRPTYCSLACRQAHRARAREKVCGVCGEAFTATRADAKTCSPACRQKAYRLRRV